MLELKHAPRWHWRRAIWTDICKSALPTTLRKANAQALARKSSTGWMSDDARGMPESMRGNKRELVLAGNLLARVLARVLDASVDTGQAARGVAGLWLCGRPCRRHDKLHPQPEVSINCRFRDDQLEVTFVALGGGFYQGGAITDEFKRSLKEHGLKVFHGDDASIQPGSSGDRWPRETSVS